MNARTLSTPILLAATSLALACGGGKKYDNTNASTGTVDSTAVQTQQSTGTDTTAAHHSVLGGAVAGAAAGHVLGHHAIAGAAVGALIQHERNKRQATQR